MNDNKSAKYCQRWTIGISIICIYLCLILRQYWKCRDHHSHVNGLNKYCLRNQLAIKTSIHQSIKVSINENICNYWQSISHLLYFWLSKTNGIMLRRHKGKRTPNINTKIEKKCWWQNIMERKGLHAKKLKIVPTTNEWAIQSLFHQNHSRGRGLSVPLRHGRWVRFPSWVFPKT